MPKATTLPELKKLAAKESRPKPEPEKVTKTVTAHYFKAINTGKYTKNYRTAESFLYDLVRDTEQDIDVRVETARFLLQYELGRVLMVEVSAEEASKNIMPNVQEIRAEDRKHQKSEPKPEPKPEQESKPVREWNRAEKLEPTEKPVVYPKQTVGKRQQRAEAAEEIASSGVFATPQPPKNLR